MIQNYWRTIRQEILSRYKAKRQTLFAKIVLHLYMYRYKGSWKVQII